MKTNRALVLPGENLGSFSPGNTRLIKPRAARQKSRPHFCRTARATPLAVFALLCLSSACAGSGAPKGAPGDGEGCKGRTTRAVQEVQAAVDKNRSCKADQDCVTIAISADCFDACTRNVSARGEGAVKAAIDAASASECGAFQEEGCNRVTPPCAPPAPPKCNAGLCE